MNAWPTPRAHLGDETPPPPPPTRAGCRGGPRPCPSTWCRYHLPAPHGPRREESCALDVADRGQELTQYEVADLLGRAQNRVADAEARALVKLRAQPRARELAGQMFGKSQE